ncbi:hypothetical protein LguiA_000635 [Lonicera macranthoides]
MASTSLSSTTLSLPQFSPTRTIRSDRRIRFSICATGRRDDAHDQNYSHNYVDENLIVLRKRIHEMKMIERNYEPPSDWMDWEKRYYVNYDSYICEAMGILQSQLMKTRPSFAIGIVALIALSVPTSMAVMVSHLMEILAGFHF